MKQWYVTVGVPGGEIACLAENRDAAIGRLLDAADQMLEKLTLKNGNVQSVRLAPPELVEWLNYPGRERPPCEIPERRRVPGGWIYLDRAERTFIPVALASGITVLEATDA